LANLKKAQQLRENPTAPVADQQLQFTAGELIEGKENRLWGASFHRAPPIFSLGVYGAREANQGAGGPGKQSE